MPEPHGIQNEWIRDERVISCDAMAIGAKKSISAELKCFEDQGLMAIVFQR